MVKVSVIVTVYNKEPYILETLQSIKKQTYDSFECIVVNDGSTDSSSVIIYEFCKDDARFTCYDKRNEGVSIARNFGIEHSHGEYILPIDGDDLVEPEYIKECVKILDDDDEVKVVYSRADMFGSAKGEWRLPEFSMENMLAQNCIYCSALYRRKDYDRTVGYNPNMKEGLEDWDFWISLLGYGGKVYKIDKIMFHYRIVKSSRNRSFDIEKRKRLRKQMWLNNRDVYANYYLDPLNTIEYLSAIRIKQSCDYRLGRLMLYPLRRLKRLFWGLH